MAQQLSKQKINAIIRHRKNKNLCIKCGKDLHEGDCEENYEKTDNRDVVEDNNSDESTIEEKKPEISTKTIETIVSYRKRKDLCIKCGKNVHSGECEENYEKSDMRSEEEKQERPAIVHVQTEPPKSILEKIKTNDTVLLKPDKNIKLLRDFIIIDLNPSRFKKTIDWNAVLQISRKYENLITFVSGDIENLYNIVVLNSLKRLPRIQRLMCKDEQEYINYIASCSMFYSYPSRYTQFSVYSNIDTAIFDEKYCITSFLKNINYVLTNKE